MKPCLLIALLGVLGGHLVAWSADVPPQPIARKGALLFKDDFGGTELNKPWRVSYPTFEANPKGSGLAVCG